MNERIIEAMAKFLEEQKKYEGKQLERESLRRREVEFEKQKDSLKRILAERKKEEGAAIDAFARGEISEAEYQGVVDARVAAERALVENQKFIRSIEKQVLALEVVTDTAQGPQDNLTIAYQTVYRLLFEEFMGNISKDKDCLSKIHRAYVTFFLSGAGCDWHYFLSQYLKLAPPTKAEFIEYSQELQKILSEKTIR
jgi:hypothetical protein